MSAHPDLSIVIVSWNVSALLKACLESIYRNAGPLHIEVIVVDSASSDNTVTMIRTAFPQVTLLAQSENVGFTRGNNIGLRQAGGQALFLLNPDTELIGDCLAQLVSYLEANPRVGIVGPHTLNTDGTYQSTRRRFPTRTLAFFESTWLQPFAPAKLLEDFTFGSAPETATLDVDWVQGSALMARRAVLEQIGGLDEGYVMYSEEMDWCKRAKSAGWGVVYLGSASLIHHGGKSSEQVAARKHIHFQESKLRYFRKYHGRGFAAILRVFLLLNYLWQIALEGGKSALGHKRALRQERIRAYWQVLRSGLRVS